MKNLIVSHYAGSIAYGTSTPQSDVDVRGIFCADKINICTPFFPIKEQSVPGEDTKYYEVANYLNMYTQANPNIIESLWVDEKHIIESSVPYRLMRNMREELLSSRVAFTFSGYAFAQLKRIKGHSKWISQPWLETPPDNRRYVSLIQNFTEKKVLRKDFRIEDWNDHTMLHYGNNIFGVCDTSAGSKIITSDGKFNNTAKKESVTQRVAPALLIKYNEEVYRKDVDNHRSYKDWKLNRNEKRSILEEKHGYDTKHAHHLVRLLRMAVEILRTGQVYVLRDDAEELKAIRDGAWTYEEIVEYAEHMNNEVINVHYKNTHLPKTTDIHKAAKLLIQCQEYFWDNA